MYLFINTELPEVIHQQYKDGLITNVILPYQKPSVEDLTTLLEPILEKGYLFKHIVVKLPSLKYGESILNTEQVDSLFEEASALRKLSKSITFELPFSELGVALNKRITSAGLDTLITGINSVEKAMVLSQNAPSLMLISPSFFEQNGDILGNHFAEFKLPTKLVVDGFYKASAKNSKYLYGATTGPLFTIY